MNIYKTPDDYGLDPDEWENPDDMDGTKVSDGDFERRGHLSYVEEHIQMLKRYGLYEKYGPIKEDENGNPIIDPDKPWWMQFKSPSNKEEEKE